MEPHKNNIKYRLQKSKQKFIAVSIGIQQVLSSTSILKSLSTYGWATQAWQREHLTMIEMHKSLLHNIILEAQKGDMLGILYWFSLVAWKTRLRSFWENMSWVCLCYCTFAKYCALTCSQM